MEEYDFTKCTCEERQYDEHNCPFQSDVHDDPDFLCRCCSYCEQNCADNI